MTMITADTPWRATGDTDAESLRTEFATRGIPGRTSPLAAYAAEILRAASPYGRLLAAMSWVEQKHGTYFESPIPATSHNFMSMAQGWDAAIGGHTWYRFDAYADCAAFWKARLESPAGPYAADVTIRELITTYAPPGPPDFNRTEEYIQDVVAVINRLRPAVAVERPVVFGNVPNPGIEVRLIDKPENSGWNDRGPRNIVGVCVHRMLGTLTGTDEHFRQTWVGALTDFGIGGAMDGPALDGAIWQWNALEGRRRPWASGWAEHEDPEAVAEGHGREFRDIWRHQGYDLNRDLASIELSGCTAEIAEWRADGTPIWADWCGRVETPVTPKQFEALAALIAYIADRYCRISYQDFPFNPNVGEGFYAVYQHFEFAGKNCPYSTVRGMHEDYVARVKEILEHYQTQGAVFTPFTSPRVFHVRADARGTGRPEPHLGSAWVRLFGPGEAVATDGVYQGATVAGESRWLRTADANHLAIHVSAFAEAI